DRRLEAAEVDDQGRRLERGASVGIERRDGEDEWVDDHGTGGLRASVRGKIPRSAPAKPRVGRRRGSRPDRGRSRRPMTISPSRGSSSGLMQESIADVDPELWAAMLGERRRQHDNIEL